MGGRRGWGALALALAGCSSGSAGDAGSVVAADATGRDATSRYDGPEPVWSPPPLPVAPSELGSRLAAAFCAHRTRCEPAVAALLGQDEAACVAERARLVAGAHEALAVSVAQGTSTFDLAAFERCLEAYRTADCGRGLDVDACRYFTGTVGEGGGCSLPSGECAPELYCDRPAVSGTRALPLCGTCERPARAGEACDPRRCAAGNACLGSICVPFTADVDQPCSAAAACRGRLRCVSGRCVRPAAIGQRCAADDVGAPGCNPAAGAICAGGRCEALSYASAGQSCAGASLCTASNTCRVQDMTCVALPREGAACAAGACAPGTVCGGLRCERLSEEGGGCAGPETCAAPLECRTSTSAGDFPTCGQVEWRACRRGERADGGVQGDAGAPAPGDAGVSAPDAGPPAPDAGGEPPSPSLDPAPGARTPGEHACAGCPDTDLTRFTYTMPYAPLLTITGTVTGAAGGGAFHVASRAGAQIAGLVAVAASGAFEAKVPLFCGAQTVKLVFENGAGAYAAVIAVETTRCTEPALRVTLVWDGLGVDWELHLIRGGGRIYDGVSDCTWSSCVVPNLDWGAPGDRADDPHKELDTDARYGPESIVIPAPAPDRYTVLVEHWGAGDPSSDGALFVTSGAATWVARVSDLAPMHVWTAATVDWPGPGVTSPGTDFDCTSEWRGGCFAPLP